MSARRCDIRRCTALAADRMERVNGRGYAIEMMCEPHADAAMRAGTHVLDPRIPITVHVPSFPTYSTSSLVTALAVADEFRLLGFSPEVRSDL